MQNALCKVRPVGGMPLTKKLMRVMRLTAILLLIGTLHVCAKGNSQSITLRGKNITLESAFSAVKSQTGYLVFCNYDLLGKSKPVNVDVTNMPLMDFLNVLLKDQQLEYTVENNTILIKSKLDSLAGDLNHRLSPPPPITVRGRIVNEKGEPVAASVIIKGTKIGVTTDSYGSFELQNVPDNATLIISGISIEPQEIKLNGRTEINIRAITKIAAEDEVTISTGYISSTKRKSTANISKVTSGQIENQPVTNPLTALQGRVAGLEITPSSGVAGAAPKIRIRGENSLRNTSDNPGGNPLYIIDGVPFDSRVLQSGGQLLSSGGLDPLSSINVANIESVEILKDGAATGIYGSRGANGVILITTKKYKTSSESRLEVNYYAGAGKVNHFVDMLNTPQYLEMRREAIQNDGGVIGDFDFDINGTYDTTRDVNWQKKLLGGSAKISDLQIFFSGGQERTNFRIGGSLHKETTIYPGDFGFRNITGSANITHVTLNNKFRLSLTTNYANNLNNVVNSSPYVSRAITLAPNSPELYTDSGELNWQPVLLFGGTYKASSFINPLAELLKTEQVNTETFFSSLNLQYNIVPGLQLKSNFGFNTLKSVDVSKFPIAAQQPEAITAFAEGSSVFTNNTRSSWIIEPQLIYTTMLKQHSFTAIIGGSLQQSNNALQSINGSGYKSDVLLGSVQAAPVKQYTIDEASEYRYVAGFGIVKYDFDSKYLIDLNFRRDGSSRFGPGRQFGNFGAIGAGWIFSNEKPLEHSQWLSFGKLRTSYAITGNDQIRDYQYYGTYRVTETPYLGYASLAPNALFNSNLAWEETKKFETALELGFFKNRVSMDIVYYKNRSANQLISYRLPLTTGFRDVFKNFEATVQNAGWEFTFSSKNLMKKNFRWTSSFNISFPKNKLLSFPNIESSSYATRYKVGESLGLLSQYYYTGVDPVTGAYTFLDVDSNGIINTRDLLFTYSTDRQWYGGMINTVSYKSFELSFLLQFSKQNGYKMIGALPGSSYTGNQPDYIIRRWRKPGDITDVQRYNANFALAEQVNNLQQSDYQRADASFIRLKTLTLAWMMPATWISKLKMHQARLIIQGQNLFTITDFEGLDPESGPATLPPLTMLTVGLNLNF